MLVYFLLGTKIILLFCSIDLRRIEAWIKKLELRVYIVLFRFSLGGGMEKLVITDVTKYLIELMKIDSE